MTEGPRRYSVIYADPPWAFKTYSDKGKDRAPDQHYGVMTIDAICALPVQEWSAQNALLFLWVYQPMLPDALRVMEAWGFNYVTVGFFWVKVSGGQDRLFYATDNVRKGLGYYTRAGAEQCWIGKRGNGVKRFSMGEGQVVFSPLREHSRKPDEIAESIVELCGDVPRLEMFARTKRPGWDHFGNETGKFDDGRVGKTTVE